MLRLPRFRMIEPTTWTAAATLLREHGAGASDVAGGTPNVPVMLVAGGTDLFPNMKRRQFTPQVLVSLGGVKGAREVSNGATGRRTAEGYCMKTHPSVVCRVAPSSARCLAVASADTVPALIALGATVTVENADGRRELDLAELYREDGIRYLAIGRDDVVVSVTLPDATGWRSTYLKLRDRNSFDFPIAGVAAAVRLDGGKVSEARIAITALASRPVAVDAKALVGTKLDDEAIAAAADAVHKAARPMDNTSGTISQRKRAARVFTERALRSLRDA